MLNEEFKKLVSSFIREEHMVVNDDGYTVKEFDSICAAKRYAKKCNMSVITFYKVACITHTPESEYVVL